MVSPSCHPSLFRTKDHVAHSTLNALVNDLVIDYAQACQINFSQQTLSNLLALVGEDYRTRGGSQALHNKIEISSLPNQLKAFIHSLVLLVEKLKYENKLDNLPKLDSPEEVEKFFYTMRFLENELLKVLCLSEDNRLLASQDISMGSENQVLAKPQRIFSYALSYGAKKIILLHNHPSGYLNPSEEDLIFTRKVEQGSQIIGIKLLDHIIIGNGYYSFSENQLI